jgi:two-component system NtrC family response regulator
MATLLVIDARNRIPEEFGESARRLGHTLLRVSTVDDALQALSSSGADVVFLAALPKEEMTGAFFSMRRVPAEPEIIVFRNAGTAEEAEDAIKAGAWDYVDLPGSPEGLRLLLFRVLEYRAQRPKARTRNVTRELDGIVGISPHLQSCVELVQQAADSDANVLIVGETGTGKELFAAAIHANSSRAKKNFVVVDCAALPENLVESTLLGHERGAFTGAESAHVGLIKQADGGTLFLDEISELPFEIQKSFLRVLQERRYRPVGASHELESNFRIIAASNRNLDHMAERGEFRKDLLFRVRAFTLELLPLREHRDDVAPLVQYHVPRLCERMGVAPKEVSPDFFRIVEGYSWPGNVRELVNALDRAIVSARDEQVLFPAHLPTYIRVHLAQATLEGQGEERTPGGRSTHESSTLRTFAEERDTVLAESEKRYLNDLLELSGGSVPAACRISGLSRSRLYALLKKHGLSFRGR